MEPSKCGRHGIFARARVWSESRTCECESSVRRLENVTVSTNVISTAMTRVITTLNTVYNADDYDNLVRFDWKTIMAQSPFVG